MKDSLIIWKDKAWSGGFLFAAWFTFVGFFITAYTLFYAGLDDIGMWVFACGSGFGLLALIIAVWAFRKGRTGLCMNVDWDNNSFVLDCDGREINIETPDRISGFGVFRITGGIDSAVTIATGVVGSPIAMREEDWYIGVLYGPDNDCCRHVWNCVSKREGKKIVNKLNQLLHSRLPTS